MQAPVCLAMHSFFVFVFSLSVEECLVHLSGKRCVLKAEGSALGSCLLSRRSSVQTCLALNFCLYYRGNEVGIGVGVGEREGVLDTVSKQRFLVCPSTSVCMYRLCSTGSSKHIPPKCVRFSSAPRWRTGSVAVRFRPASIDWFFLL